MGNVSLLKIYNDKKCIMSKMTQHIFYIIFTFFILYIQITKILVWVTFNKLEKIHIYDVEKERTSKERVKYYKRCITERASFDAEDKNLVNQLGIPFLELEKAFEPFSETLLLNNNDFVCPINVSSVLAALIKGIFVDNLEHILPYLVFYKKAIDVNLYSLHNKLKKKVKNINNQMKRDIKNFLSSLEPDVQKEIMILYYNLELDKLHDERYLKMKLYQLQYLTHIRPLSKFIFTRFEKHCKYIKKQKTKLEDVMKTANNVTHIFNVEGIENRMRFPFFMKDILFPNEVASFLCLLTEIANRVRKNLCDRRLHNCKMMHYINRYRLEDNYRVITSIISLTDDWIKYTMQMLLKRLSTATGGPLRGILAMFLYIFKKAKTKNIHSYNEQWYSDQCIFNKKLIKYYLKLLYKKEEKLINRGYIYFKTEMYFLFKIDVTNKKLNNIWKRLAYSEELDEILKYLHMATTLIFIKKQLLYYVKLLNDVQDRINEKIEKKRKELNDPIYTPVYVTFSLFSFSDVNYALKQKTKLFDNILKVFLYSQDIIDARTNIIISINLLQKVRNWLSLFENVDQSNHQFTQEKKKIEKDTFSKYSTKVGKKKKKTQEDTIELSQSKLISNKDPNELNISENIERIDPRALYLLFYIIYNSYYYN